MTLDAAYYTQGDAFQREKRTVFAQEWLPIAVREQLAQPGQYVAASVGGWPMLAVCGTDGVTRAFRNTCRHKNMLLVEQDSGVCETFRCRFHGWTYDRAGALCDAPPAVAPAGDRAQHGLVPMGLQAWQQVILVNLQSPEPPADVGELDSTCGVLVAACRHHAGMRMMDVACNWKTLLESVLNDDAVIWRWPTLLLRAAGDALWIDQIVPRTFLRTRVVRHVYVAAPGASGVAQPALTLLDVLKSQAEQLQVERAQGKTADATPMHVAALHARLANAYASDMPA